MDNPCELVTNTNIKDRTIQIATQSTSDKTERGFLIMDIDDTLYMGPIEVGQETSVSFRVPSKFGIGLFPLGDVVGVVHVHPLEKFESVFSVQDIKQLIEGDLEFSVVAFDNEGEIVVDVMTPKMYNTMSELADDIGRGVSRLEFIRRANQLLVECTEVLGDKNE